MATIEELKEVIVNLRLKIVMLKIPEGDCPYFYYDGESDSEGSGKGCRDLDCNVCRSQFYRNMIKRIQDEVAAW